MVFEDLDDVNAGMFLEGLRDAAVDVLPAREPRDLLALGFRLAGDDRLLDGALLRLGERRRSGFRAAGERDRDQACRQECDETRHVMLPWFPTLQNYPLLS